MLMEVRGKNLFFEVLGSHLTIDGAEIKEKPILILLHGGPGGSDHTVYRPIFDHLSDIAQIIFLDMAGCGRSEPPVNNEYSIESWADDVAELCRLLGIVKPIVLGNSAGGMVAGVLATRHPDVPGKVVLASTQARITHERSLEMFRKLGGDNAVECAKRALIDVCTFESIVEFSEVCMTLYNTTPQTHPRTSILRPEAVVGFHEKGGAWHRMDFLDELPNVTCPVMVMVGDHDPITPVADSEDMVKALPPHLVRYERFTNSGHSVWRDEPEKAFRVIREFILAP
jgi:pimeloyl-ACP methyl ester carboxylesterase